MTFAQRAALQPRDISSIVPAGDKPEDVVILGGGLAGLFTALKLAQAERRVSVLCGAPLGQGAASVWAQGGIAASVGEGDTFELHAADTIAAGAGLCDEAIVHGVTYEGAARIADLLACGAPFDRDLDGRLSLSREAAHSRARVVRVGGDTAGRAVMQALIATVRKTPSIRVLEGFVGESLMREGNRVCGLITRRKADGLRLSFAARGVVLASGGAGHLYEVTTNPPEAAGQGLAMAARAGAVIADAEFVQFHPTAIDIGLDPAPLATEALRGEGAILVNLAGERFMEKIHPLKELAPRDVVARAIHREVTAGRGAFLDARACVGTEFPERFPTVYAACLGAGIDPVSQPIPVRPAAHYHMGGVWTDARGRSSLPGLWAAGEVASTGLHGANRLASNSLLEAAVFANRIATDIAATMPECGVADWRPLPGMTTPLAAQASDRITVARLRKLMATKVGVMRDGAGLKQALAELATLSIECDGIDCANMLVCARMITAAALLREESRGGHFRTDHPTTSPAVARRALMTLEEINAVIREALGGDGPSVPARTAPTMEHAR
ncbi:L-aspartate oxidase [Breoghania sp.]|uniref:L-aspartate oxidase n=1 Tax=Breoghania sp. TaxID=2065378 RepID=UPI002AA690BB|nr:L-aspartate oxidase [Breoghania sp.]